VHPRTESGELCPAQVYAIAELIQIKTTDRGDGVWAASYDAGMSSPGYARYVTAIDKERRVKVRRAALPPRRLRHGRHSERDEVH